MRDKKRAVKENTKKHFNRAASKYETSHAFSGPLSQNELMYERIREIPFENLLDIGCGTGILLSRILETRDVRVSGIDISKEMLGIARERLGDRAELVEGDSENLPFGDGEFDLVTWASTFHRFPDPANVLAEIGRVMAPGGTLVIKDCCSVFPLR
ncbi:MAG: class I SAM-dependent methyltransferase [Actinomycetota bacterium]|nr:class I SAM-dependent methyltransferase [Actinomycetota bacterium]